MMPSSSAVAWSSKSKRSAEPFSHRQSPGAGNATSEGGVNHELHSAAFIEKSFVDDFFLRGNESDRGLLCGDVGDDLVGRFLGKLGQFQRATPRLHLRITDPEFEFGPEF